MINNSFNGGDVTLNGNQVSETKLLENEMISDILTSLSNELESIG